MAHAASQLKKNRGEVDVNAIEDEKEKRRKSRRAASRELKRKVTDRVGWTGETGGRGGRGGRDGGGVGVTTDWCPAGEQA
ncbi:hypothetical protein NHX12_022026 [Muraenolepis orangiensis]|uniref:Uncharacterized protein n=1 Tax=Muraenolepis orangiensis TaxID=630683 RepID=A0A9Q0ESQ9_9TELE|nr:hypothetical protein NHX12_022026 [Muraenolepis orangiensis]